MIDVEIEAIDPAGYTDAIMNPAPVLPTQIKIKASQTSGQPHHLDR